MVNSGLDEKLLKKYGFKVIDLAYLMDDQRAILQMELSKQRPNKRVLHLLKRLASVSKRVEGLSTQLKGYDMDTKAMEWIIEMYSSTPPSSPEYKDIEDVVHAYTKVQIWLGGFFTLLNAFSHSINLRQLSAAEKIMKKMELEVERARKIFREYGDALKKLRAFVLGGHEEDEHPYLLYFT